MTDIQLPTTINNNNDIIVDELEQCKKIMNNKCDTIAESLFKFKRNFNINNVILQSNYRIDEDGNKVLNNNFDNIELIEENLDELFYAYQLIKNQIADARNMYLTIEKLNKNT